MARQKATITLDRGKAEEARALVGAESTSAVIDMALGRLIRTERLRRDIAAYRATPPTDDELVLAELAARGDLSDDTDWAALYAGQVSAAPRRGDVWLADLDKTRPVIVLTRDPMGRYLNAVLVAPVTSTIRGLSTEVPVGPSDGIRVESVANLDNTQLISRSRLQRRVGRATPDTMAALCRALATSVDCPGR